METKLITKTIKELADEFDSNVEQLHRTISEYEKLTKDQKKEIVSLRYGIQSEIWARARAEIVSETSILAMYFVIAIMFSISVHNYLFG